MCVLQVKYYRDTYAEHPEDRKNIEYTVHLGTEYKYHIWKTIRSNKDLLFIRVENLHATTNVRRFGSVKNCPSKNMVIVGPY